MKRILRSFLTLLMLVTWASGFAQDTETIDLTQQGFKNNDVVSVVNGSDVTLTFVKGENAKYTPTYYTNKSGNSVRLYAECTLKITSSTKTIKKITFTTVKNKGNELKSTYFSAGTYAQNTWRGETNNLSISPANVIWLQKLEITYATTTKTLKSLAISGDATKKAYNEGEEFDPTGLVVTGTYDDASTAAITDGITWTKTPATLALGNTSCSVTATVNGVTSPAYEVTGLSVTKTISLSIEPATSTVVKAPVMVTLTATSGATVYYTTNGDEPSTSSEKYVAPFEVTKSETTVKAIAVAEGAKDVKAEATYTIKPEQPVFSDESKTFSDAFDVKLSLPESTDATSTIHYAIGKKATADSPLYDVPVNISAEKDGDKVILHAVVVDQYGNVGMEKYCTYTKTTAIVFDFTANPNAWGITPSTNVNNEGANVVAGKELAVEGVVMTATNGTSQATCLYSKDSSVSLNVYKGGSITFTAPEGYNITEITFEGTNLTSLIVDKVKYNGTWTGNAHAVKFSNDGKKIEIKKANIKLVALANPTLPLDENAETSVTEKALKDANTAGSVYDVKLARTLTANVWNTICLPFDVTAEQIANVLKSAGNVKEFDREDATKQTIYFKDATTMVAGKPYLIKPTESAKELVFKGVKITEYEADASMGNQYGVCGTFVPYKLSTDGTDLFLKTDGKFYVPDSGKETMKGFRAYFLVPKNTTAAALNLSFGDATGINGVAADAEKNVKVYNVNGQYVGTNLEALPKGLYIVGGKKVLK